MSQPFRSLVMSDGYEPGEPHWQISSDGRMTLSVMAGDESDVQARSDAEEYVVWRDPWHKVYYSPTIWDLSDRGR